MNLSPKQIVAELDKYIVGQSAAKKAVAIALRNRYRRSMLTPTEMEEITPKNKSPHVFFEYLFCRGVQSVRMRTAHSRF